MGEPCIFFWVHENLALRFCGLLPCAGLHGHYQSKDQDIRSTILAVTYTLTEQNMAKVHAIRTGKKGNDPQLVVDNYGAHRRDITTSIKLAYWKKGREYKIANMREHDFIEPTWEN